MESIMKKHIARLVISIVALSSIAAVAVKNHRKSTTNSTAVAAESSCKKSTPEHKKCCKKQITDKKQCLPCKNDKKCDEKKASTKKCRSNHRKQHGKPFKKEESKNNDTQTKKIGS